MWAFLYISDACECNRNISRGNNSTFIYYLGLKYKKYHIIRTATHQENHIVFIASLQLLSSQARVYRWFLIQRRFFWTRRAKDIKLVLGEKKKKLIRSNGMNETGLVNARISLILLRNRITKKKKYKKRDSRYSYEILSRRPIQ